MKQTLSSLFEVGRWMWELRPSPLEPPLPSALSQLPSPIFLLLPLFLAATSSALASTVRYVDVNSASPTPPYTSWATAARVIQDAIDVAVAGDEIVVTNGIYDTVWVDKPVTLRSLNGPDFAVINGGGLGRCAHMASGSSLAGFTLTNGVAAGFSYGEQLGGGLYCDSTNVLVTNCVIAGNLASSEGGGAYSGTLNNCTLRGNSTSGYSLMFGNGGGASDNTLNNCTLIGNSAMNLGGGACGSRLNNCTLVGNLAGSGGGASGGEGTPLCLLNNCTLTENSASGRGGGAYSAMLNNCTLADNSANWEGGGAAYSTLNNCIVCYNTAPGGANYLLGTLYYCCSTPKPTNGFGNITNAPLFVDYPGGNLRLQSNSPCINAGTNAYALDPTDLDGNPRIISGTVDIGAYEFQGPGSAISYAWLQQYALPTDGSADFTDPDGDGMNDWQEWRCQTDPTNALSALRLLSTTPAGRNVIVTWQSVAGVNYFLECSTNLSVTPSFTPLATSIPGQPGTTTFTDTNSARLAALFYRVGVQ